jgi:hypothetical protein
MVEGGEDVGFRIGVAPGVLAIGGVCGVAPPCLPARIKLGTKDWQPLGIPAGARFSSLELDAAHDRLFVLTVEDNGTGVYAGKQGEPLKKLDVAFEKGTPRASTIDATGTLRLVFDHPWRIEKVSAELKPLPRAFLPFDPRSLDLAGNRGYAWSDYSAFETADGGDHWASVPAGATGSLACGTSGCLQNGAVGSPRSHRDAPRIHGHADRYVDEQAGRADDEAARTRGEVHDDRALEDLRRRPLQRSRCMGRRRALARARVERERGRGPRRHRRTW